MGNEEDEMDTEDLKKTTTLSSQMKFSTLPREMKFIMSIGIIYFCYIYYAIVQERIMKSKWGKDDMFTFTSFALLFQSVFNVISAKLVQVILNLKPNIVPAKEYLFTSLCYVGAMFFSNFALHYVSYPTQVLAKSCKPIPVILVSRFLLNRSYRPYKYLCVFVMCCGMMLFAYFPSEDTTVTTATGYLMLFCSLSLDGITGPFQEALVSKYEPSSNNMMMYSNLWAMAVLFLVFCFSGEMVPAMDFCAKYPIVLVLLTIFSLLSAIGQIMIFYVVAEFGALTLSIVTTSRKFFTVLGSVVIFQHELGIGQWMGVVLVFLGLSLDLYLSQSLYGER